MNSLLQVRGSVAVIDQEKLDREGFQVIRDLVPEHALEAVQRLLDPLFDDFDEIPSSLKLERASDASAGGASRAVEINRCLGLAPALRQSEVFERCREVASAYLGRCARYTFDHAIYKEPACQLETPWHQDEAYRADPFRMRTVHFWIPLHAVGDNGSCMRFVPKSHLRGLGEHDTIDADHVLEAQHVERARAVSCPLSAGSVTVHLPRTLHSTGPNLSERTRRAWVLHFGSTEHLLALRASSVLQRVRTLLGGDR